MKLSKMLSMMLSDAANKGDLDGIRKALADGADPKADFFYALRLAALNGHTDCVELLIPVTDPKALDSEALRWAVIAGHTDCVKLLFPVSDVEAAKTRLKGGVWNYAVYLLDAIIEEEALKAKHLKSTDERARVGL